MVSKIIKTVATALTVIALAACSGGGSGSPGSTSPGAGSASAPQSATVLVSLFVPKDKSGVESHAVTASSAQRLKPLYLPTSVNSVSIQQTESAGAAVTGAPITVLVIGSSNCTTVAGGQTCTATLTAALGVDAWAFSSYVTGNATGTAVSVNTGSLTVVSGAANVLSVTLNPILASLAFLPLADSANDTATLALPLVLQAKDTTGAIIIGPGTYVTAANVALPITLTTSSSAVVLQTSSGTAATLTVTTTASNDLGKFAYNGSLPAGTQTITAAATGITTASFNLTLAAGLVVPASIALGENLGTTTAALAISDPGYTGTFTLTGPSCANIVSFPGTTASTSPTVTQIAGGTCTILVSDGTNSGSVTVYSTTFGIVLQ